MGRESILVSSKSIAFAAALMAAGVSVSAQAAQTCEIDRPVVFADLDWDSNAFHVEVAKFIVEKGYGCEVEAMPGSTLPLLNGMARGDVDITMEMWIDNVQDAWDKQHKAGKVVNLGVNFPDAVQGWFVPRYLVEGKDAKAPGLKSVYDLPKYKDLFRDPEEPDKGRFYNGILGWGAEKISTKKLNAYKLTDHYTNFRPGTGTALASAIAAAYKRQKPILYYYWGPTWVMGLYDGVMLEEPAYDKKTWDAMMAEDAPKAATAFPLMKAFIAVNAKFEKKAPKIVSFLKSYETSNALVSKALVYMQDHKGATPKDAAMDFLKNRSDVWMAWVPQDVGSAVKTALK